MTEIYLHIFARMSHTWALAGIADGADSVGVRLRTVVAVELTAVDGDVHDVRPVLARRDAEEREQRD